MTVFVLLLVFLGTLVVVGGGLTFVNRRRLLSTQSARDRLADVPTARRGEGGPASTILRDQRVSKIRALNELLSGRGLTQQLAGELVRAGSRQRPGEFLLTTAVTGLVGMTLVSYAIGALLGGIIGTNLGLREALVARGLSPILHGVTCTPPWHVSGFMPAIRARVRA